jgi:hypothetical protein
VLNGSTGVTACSAPTPARASTFATAFIIVTSTITIAATIIIITIITIAAITIRCRDLQVEVGQPAVVIAFPFALVEIEIERDQLLAVVPALSQRVVDLIPYQPVMFDGMGDLFPVRRTGDPFGWRRRRRRGRR